MQNKEWRKIKWVKLDSREKRVGKRKKRGQIDRVGKQVY